MNVTGPQQHGGGAGTTEHPVAVQQTTVIQMGGQKSVVGAVLLAFFFGPLGMLYATVPGALVMFVISLIVVIPTLGLGLIVTIPACAIWAGVAANSHNRTLGAMSMQAVGGVVPGPYTAPAAWHDDPQGSGRLRYYDGTRWTDKYADKPGGPPPQAQIAQADTTVLETGAGACESCGGAIEGNDRFCPACGHEQAEN